MGVGTMRGVGADNRVAQPRGGASDGESAGDGMEAIRDVSAVIPAYSPYQQHQRRLYLFPLLIPSPPYYMKYRYAVSGCKDYGNLFAFFYYLCVGFFL